MGASMFLMMVLSSLVGFVIGAVRCPWSALRCLKSLVQYAAATIQHRGKIGAIDQVR